MSDAVVRLIVYGALAVAAWFAYHSWAAHQQDIGEDRATTRYNVQIEKQQHEARELLAAANAHADGVEKALAETLAEQEKKDRANQQNTLRLERRLSSLAGSNGGRLRDPNADARCGGGRDPASGAPAPRTVVGDGDGAQAGGLLSVQLTSLLQRATREADEISDAYRARRDDGRNLRRLIATQCPAAAGTVTP